MGAQSLSDEVQALERLDLEGLRAVWKRRYKVTPKLRSPELLRLALAWRMQAEAFGGLDAATRRRLRTRAAAGRSDHVSAGVIITKEWRGQTYEVMRNERGYQWNNQAFRSLSAVATAITGVKRNGPSFFGLREGEAV